MKVHYNFNKSTFKKLQNAPDVIMYEIARQTLDRIGSSKITPRNTGKMEQTMFNSGVRGSNGNYEIGNYTNYAQYVYKMNGVNWTNPLSKAQWFDTFWKSNGGIIADNIIARYRL